MKKFLVSLVFFASLINSNAQQINLCELPFFEGYEKANEFILKEKKVGKRVVFLGNSITADWVNYNPDFFIENNYIGRGISGQTSVQLLLRFRQDVVELQADIVVICVAANDIAENIGIYRSEFTLDNIRSMVDIAHANDIKVLLASVLPVNYFYWNREVKGIAEKVDDLNIQLKAYANENNLTFVDYNARMRNINGGIIATLSRDGIHPNYRGFRMMESIVKPILDKVLNQ